MKPQPSEVESWLAKLPLYVAELHAIGDAWALEVAALLEATLDADRYTHRDAHLRTLFCDLAPYGSRRARARWLESQIKDFQNPANPQGKAYWLGSGLTPADPVLRELLAVVEYDPRCSLGWRQLINVCKK